MQIIEITLEEKYRYMEIMNERFDKKIGYSLSLYFFTGGKHSEQDIVYSIANIKNNLSSYVINNKIIILFAVKRQITETKLGILLSRHRLLITDSINFKQDLLSIIYSKNFSQLFFFSYKYNYI